jgi:uncharacterized membrane protein
MKPWLAAITLGAVTGLRSISGVALISRQSPRIPHRRAGDVARTLSRPAIGRMVRSAAAGELIADKLPSIPARVRPGPLLARIALGGVCGWWVGEASRGGRVHLGIVAASAAAVSAHAAYRARRWLTHSRGLPDGVIAVTEDVIALVLGSAAARAPR